MTNIQEENKMEPLKRRYSRKGDQRINPEYVNIRGEQVPTGLYGGIGTGAECPDCQTVLKDDWYSEPRKIHPDAESEASAFVECRECRSEFELVHVVEKDINAGMEIARSQLRNVQMATVLFTKAVVEALALLDAGRREDLLDAILQLCDEQRNQTSDSELQTHLGFLSQGLKQLSGRS